RHAERVKISCQSLLVNTIPLILTEEGGPAWVNPTYYVMKDLAMFGKGKLVEHLEDVPVYQTELFKNVPYQDVVIVDDEEDLNIFVINKHYEQTEVNLDLELGRKLCFDKVEHHVLTSKNLADKNTKDASDNVAPTIEKKNLLHKKITL